MSRITIILLFLTFTIVANTQNNLDWLKGTWQGVGYQPPTETHWAVELTYDSTGQQLLIDYPSLSCGGHWKLIDSKEGYAKFEEQITRGLDKCDNKVKVVVTCIDDEYISIAYFLPDIYDGVVAHAVLRKVRLTKTKIKIPDGRIKKT